MKTKHLINSAIIFCLCGIARAETVYLADEYSAIIDKFDSAGVYLGSIRIGVPGFSGAAIALDSGGNIYWQDRVYIQKFDASGNHVEIFPFGGNGLGIALDAGGIALDAGGSIYVSDDYPSNRVRKQTSLPIDFTDFTFATITNGTPAGLAFDHAGNLYVAIGGGYLGQPATDGPNTIPTIEKFDANGNDLGNFLQPSDFPSLSPRIRNLAFDAAGNLYATASDSPSIYKFDSAGALITSFTTPNIGVFYLDRAICVLGNGDILIAEGERVEEVSPNGTFVREFAYPFTNESNYKFVRQFADGSSETYNFGLINWSSIAIQPTPEPTSAALLGLGTLLLAARRRRSA